MKYYVIKPVPSSSSSEALIKDKISFSGAGSRNSLALFENLNETVNQKSGTLINLEIPK